MAELVLDTTLEPRGPAAAVVLTDEQVAQLGPGKVMPVRITIHGVTIAGRLARMGGENLVGLAKAARAELGVEIGDHVTVRLERAEAAPDVEVPDDLAAALDAADPQARSRFGALAPSRRKELVRAVTEAKKPETRQKRIAAAVAAVTPG